jgi:glycogen debranching enzyme
LWYNLVAFIAEKGLSLTIRREITDAAVALAERIKISFNEAFWIEDGEYLGDVRRGEWLDRAIRPNQIFAASLPNSPLSPERATKVVEKVKATLFTPVGLRTLDPADPAYRGRYEGDGPLRDNSYHNGTVWPWLLGHFGEALLKHAHDIEEAFKTIETSLSAIEAHLEEAGLGTISEIFDGDAPQGARGCVSQAWSVSEILRLSILLDKTRKAFARRNT